MCASINCSATIENLDENGCVLKRTQHSVASLEMGRNEFRDVVLRLETGKGVKLLQAKYLLKRIRIHSKFVNDGKASISLLDHNINLLLSNCPTKNLKMFVATLGEKIQAQKDGNKPNARERLISKKSQKFDVISPLALSNRGNSNQAVELVPESSSTPNSSKRKSENSDPQQPQKRLKGGSSFKPRNILLGPSGLSDEQKMVLRLVTSGRNIFFTGCAGTGKSFLLRKILQVLPPDTTFATASTGVAASNIGGMTLHAFAGVGDGESSVEQWLKMSAKMPVIDNWKKCQHLIIDEISMVGGNFFDKLEKFARIIRKRNQPFGGIQVVLSGDFLQLPPVTTGGSERIFCFQTEAWRKSVDVCYELSSIFRQSDHEFISILNNIRLGRCTDEMEAKLARTGKSVIEKDGIVATKLCTHRADVDSINEEQLKRLTGSEHVFDAVDSNPSLSSWIDKQCPVPKRMVLKIGTQVMLAKNLDTQRGLVNGSRGIITKFSPQPEGLPIVKFTCGTERSIEFEKWAIKSSSGAHSIRRQLPLKLAWAISIHKSQGMTLDCLEISLGRVFECGQAYVALSRAKSLDGLRVVDFDRKCVRADPNVLRFHESLVSKTRQFTY